MAEENLKEVDNLVIGQVDDLEIVPLTDKDLEGVSGGCITSMSSCSASACSAGEEV